mmetsp:Transcript_7797/g.13844  ORF Transcript_7797/g.13844 Transcript_7797/m.13844 type:complete len:534 (+) Transcript_7797:58-1659(+)
MAGANTAAPIFYSFANQLAAQRLKHHVPDLIVWGNRSNGRGVICPTCSKQFIALLKNHCGHAFCEDCWVQVTESRLAQCQTECRLYPPCLQCDLGMSERLWVLLCSQSEASTAHDHALRAELSLLTPAKKAFAQAPHLAQPGPVCPCCQKHCVVLLQNSCGHTACLWCWNEAAEKQLPRCLSDFRTRAMCFQAHCECPMEECIWTLVCTASPALEKFFKETTMELERLSAKAGNALVRTSQPWEAGPRCSWCGNQQLALLRNLPCHHTACEDCWKSLAAKQIPECKESLRLRPSCIDSCDHAISVGIFQHLTTASAEVSKFARDMDAEVWRLTKTASETLMWASSPCHPGLICGICDERCLALLRNTDCGHAACEGCWSTWIETQLPRCRDEKQPFLRCFGEKCQAAVDASMWSHACTRSDDARNLESLFARRRSLQRNILYPAAVQIECPQENCLGLGYRGFDTIMCFMCEHQWIADSGEPAATSMSDVVGGELMKQCPNCREYIIKNGGCDHMTCRCKHQFYWTTLKPYRG